jgi:dTDP-4-dehydrorhamnose 3,5-epimerase
MPRGSSWIPDVCAPDCDAGLLWNDASIGVDWPVPASDISISDKDAALPAFAAFKTPFTYSAGGVG